MGIVINVPEDKIIAAIKDRSVVDEIDQRTEIRQNDIAEYLERIDTSLKILLKYFEIITDGEITKTDIES